MLDKSMIDKFYEDVNRLGFKFPVAAISKATKFNKGTVSEYLNRKQSPSENFIKAFYTEFGESLRKLKEKSNHSDFKGYSGEALKDKHIALLDRGNARLEKELKVSLKNIEEDVIAVAGMNKAVLEILLILASEKKGVYNKSFEVLKKYGLEGIFL